MRNSIEYFRNLHVGEIIYFRHMFLPTDKLVSNIYDEVERNGFEFDKPYLVSYISQGEGSHLKDDFKVFHVKNNRDNLISIHIHGYLASYVVLVSKERDRKIDILINDI